MADGDRVIPDELDYSRIYLRWHDDSDEHFERQSAAELIGLKAHLPADKSARILEFGCGRGFALAGVTRAGYTNIEGIDADTGQITAGLRRGLNLRRVAIADTAAFLDARIGLYDFIYAIDVIEHIPVTDTISVLSRLQRCLKPGGKFLCRVPNGDHLIAGHLRYLDPSHYTAFTDSSLDLVLHCAGFTAIRVFPTGDGMPRLRPKNLNRLIDWALRRVFRGVHFLILRAEFGVFDARRTSLTPNILGVGYAPPLPDHL